VLNTTPDSRAIGSARLNTDSTPQAGHEL